MKTLYRLPWNYAGPLSCSCPELAPNSSLTAQSRLTVPPLLFMSWLAKLLLFVPTFHRFRLFYRFKLFVERFKLFVRPRGRPEPEPSEKSYLPTYPMGAASGRESYLPTYSFLR